MTNFNYGKYRKQIEFLVFVIPAIIFIMIATIIPFFLNFFYAFTDWNGIAKIVNFIGLSNFKEIFTNNPDFKAALVFTLKYSVLYVLIVNIGAIILALILDMKIRARNIMRASIFTPYVLSLIIVGFIWNFILIVGFDTLYNVIGIDVFQLSWLGNPNLAFWSVVLVSVWQSIGFYVVIYIAGLQSIPQELIEASMVDGANIYQRFWRIILPMLMPAVTVCSFFSIKSALMVFDIIFSLTNGGPGGVTVSTAMDIYREAFINNRYGLAIAKSLIFFLLVVVITMLSVKFLKAREVEV